MCLLISKSKRLRKSSRWILTIINSALVYHQKSHIQHHHFRCKDVLYGNALQSSYYVAIVYLKAERQEQGSYS